MPWKTILKSVGLPPAASLRGLLDAIGNALGMRHDPENRPVLTRAAFTAAVVGLSAKLAKADGVALRIEEETFERLFPVEPEEVENVRWLFALASRDTAGFETYAHKIASMLATEPELKQHVFEALLQIAAADGVLHESEDSYLSSVRSEFGYTGNEYKAMRARFVRDINDPYVALGVSRDISNEALKTHYRRIVRENHPDTLAAKGLGKELQERATRKIAAINAAYDEIAQERKL
jgi:DnaJ like chaperone protein